MILAIETSASVCSVGFYFDNRIIAEYQSTEPMKHSELVGTFVEKGLQETKQDIHLVTVAIGPGSFTGLRIGLSYAQGFCFGKNIPIVGVSNHQVLAKQGKQNIKTYTIIDAHRHEVYLAKHKMNSMMDIESHKIVKISMIEEELPENCQLLFLEGTLSDEKIEDLSQKNIICTTGKYNISILSEIGHIKFLADGGKNPEDLQPMYIRTFAGV